jgi:hypothetical protein
MLDTYIKNRGATKTLIYNNNNHNAVNEINWDADYDGKVANISVDLQNNGRLKHYDITLDNEDLANILNVPSVNMPLDRRLKRDFKHRYDPNMYKIEFEDFKSPALIPHAPQRKSEKSIEELLETIRQPPLHISSPAQNEEFIIPVTLHNNYNSLDKYTFSPKRQHRKIRSHKIHKVYKKPKSSNSKSSNSKSRKYRKKSSSPFSFL